MHPSSVLRRLTVVAGCSALAIGLAGCSDLADPTGGLAIVVGAHSNMPTPSLDGEAADALSTAIDAQSYLALVVADGEPFLSTKGALQITGKNGPSQDASRAKNEQAVRSALAAAAANTPETDLLTALDLGARAIADADGAHTVVVVDSGLSTVAPLDFTQPGMLDADPAELVASLQAADALPDLSGDAVVFEGLGDTADPQPALTRGQRKNLVEIWTAVATAAGASSVDVEQSPLTGAPAAGLPDVTPVSLPAPLRCAAGTVTLAGGDVAFESNSAAFLDAAAAADVVRPIAQQIVDGGLTATVTGTTADVGDEAGQQQLSQERAQAVADLLTSLGVPAGALTVRGLGSDFPGYVTDHDPAGDLVPGDAAQNRKVVIDLGGGSTALECS